MGALKFTLEAFYTVPIYYCVVLLFQTQFGLLAAFYTLTRSSKYIVVFGKPGGLGVPWSLPFQTSLGDLHCVRVRLVCLGYLSFTCSIQFGVVLLTSGRVDWKSSHCRTLLSLLALWYCHSFIVSVVLCAVL